MTRNTRRVGRPSSTSKEQILAVALQLAQQQDLAALSLRQLAKELGISPTSLYRYFENKHKLLLYLASWFWGWLEYKMVFATYRTPHSREKLKQAIAILTQPVEKDAAFSHIDEVLLNKIVINEYSKSYLTKEVDQENKEGYFIIYKRLANCLRDMIIAVNKDYHYPSSLASTILEGGLHQHFLAAHFPALTNCNATTTPTHYFTDLVFRALNTTTHG